MMKHCGLGWLRIPKTCLVLVQLLTMTMMAGRISQFSMGISTTPLTREFLSPSASTVSWCDVWFQNPSADTLPDYWQQSRLGRTLITLDWNRDGKMDLLANHLDQPLSLLENESESGNWVQFELVGTVSEREAIGARIEIEAGEERWTAWQIAGDGYMCTNESIIHLGLGNQKMIDKLTVHWPSSKAQVFTDVAINQRSLLIEGQSQILER